MFKNRRLEVRVVKDGAEGDIRAAISPEDVAEICTTLGYWGNRAVKGFVAVYAAVVVLNTASEIAINAAPKRLPR